jgi:hypothetical protein
MVRSKGRQLVTEVAKAAAFICCPPAERAPVDGLKRRIGELQRFRWGLRDPAGNWKLSKKRSSGRIDGMVALTMAFGVAPMRTA